MKQYINPSVEVFEMNQASVLLTSPTPGFGSGEINDASQMDKSGLFNYDEYEE